MLGALTRPLLRRALFSERPTSITEATEPTPSPAREPLLKTAATAVIFGLFTPFSYSGQEVRTPRTTNGPSVVAVRTASFEVPEYDEARAKNDLHLAALFGGEGAVAAGNGFEPLGQWSPGQRLYRGDPGGHGHLDRVMHVYGSNDGNSPAALYIPPGFKYLGPMTSENGRENGGHTFHYRTLGTQKDVYLLVFHVKDFKIDRQDRNAAGSIRIGDIGGPGGGPVDPEHPGKHNGQEFRYLHSHLAIQKTPKASGKKIPFPEAFPTEAPKTPAAR